MELGALKFPGSFQIQKEFFLLLLSLQCRSFRYAFISIKDIYSNLSWKSFKTKCKRNIGKQWETSGLCSERIELCHPQLLMNEVSFLKIKENSITKQDRG